MHATDAINKQPCYVNPFIADEVITALNSNANDKKRLDMCSATVLTAIHSNYKLQVKFLANLTHAKISEKKSHHGLWSWLKLTLITITTTTTTTTTTTNTDNNYNNAMT